MSYGLKIINPSGELVISSDARGLYCIGKATLQGSVVQPSGVATAGAPGRTWGYSVYRITHPTRVIPAIDMPLNKSVGIISVTNPAADTWDITAYCGDTPDAYGFDVQYAVDVWAFGLPSSAPSGYGMAIYDSAGSVAYDLTRPNPLFPRGYVVFPADASAASIPSLSRPVLLGAPSSQLATDDFVSSNRWAATYRRGMLKRTSSTSAQAILRTKQRSEYNDTEPAGITAEDLYATNSFILEGAGLP